MTTLTLSCAFATSNASHEHAAIAERLGYERAWFYDSPALYPDVWVQMCRAAERTERIGLGPAVLVPNLRHPMTNAAAVATLVDLAGMDRVARWPSVPDSPDASPSVSGRCPGRTYAATWTSFAACWREKPSSGKSKPIRMLHPAGFGTPRPIDVPLLIAASGPKGTAVAREVGQGIFTTAPIRERFDWNAVLTFGTVLEDGEDPGSRRAVAAAGHGGVRQSSRGPGVREHGAHPAAARRGPRRRTTTSRGRSGISRCTRATWFRSMSGTPRS